MASSRNANGQLTQNGAEQYTPLELTSLEMGSLPVTLAPVSPVPKTMPGTKQAFVKGTKASTVRKMLPAPRRALGSSGRARPRLMTLILPPWPLAQAFVLCSIQVLTLLMSRGSSPTPCPSHPQVHRCRRVGPTLVLHCASLLCQGQKQVAELCKRSRVTQKRRIIFMGNRQTTSSRFLP